VKFKMFLLSVVIAPVFASSAVFAMTDPVGCLKRFSAFPAINLPHLLAGEILGDRGSLMDFPQGICAQNCFAVLRSASETAKLLQVWNPSQHDSLNVLAFRPVRIPCDASDFQDLILNPSHHAMRWLLDKSRATTDHQSELNLTSAEAQELARCTKNHPESQIVGSYWAKLLHNRATAFQNQGFAGVLPYEVGGKPVSTMAQIREMLNEKLPVAREFASLLHQCGVFGGEPNTALTPFQYWGLCDANKRGTLNLGAVYLLPLGDHYQLLDAEYYVSGNYSSFVTLYQVWPIQAGAKSAALVWRGDFLAATTLATTKGIERLAYGTLMQQELKKVIRCFQGDANQVPISSD